MLTFFRTPNQLVNINLGKEIVGGIFYDDVQQSAHSNSERLQCRYCMKKVSRMDVLTNHLRVCPAKRARETVETFTEFKIPENREEHLEISFL